MCGERVVSDGDYDVLSRMGMRKVGWLVEWLNDSELSCDNVSVFKFDGNGKRRGKDGNSE
jgi:hypothetical protein